MSSLIAGFTTMKFNKHLKQELYKQSADFRRDTQEIRNEYTKYFLRIESEKLGNAWFDCRIYGVDSSEEAFNSVLWRIRDAEKNSRSMFAQSFCSHKELQGKTGLEQVEFCKEKTGKDWNDIDDKYKYGVLVKKELYTKDVTSDHPNAMKQKIVQRSRMISWAQHLTYSDDNVKLIMRKYK